MKIEQIIQQPEGKKIEFKEKHINPHLNEYIFQTEPKKQKSPDQKYYISDPGKDILEDILTSSRT